ncbi:hypothetical protein EWM64_g4668 [Hericium alpestre]|uniref:Uncharacterized protein n=1 Tax=Hericium alpestre TaxID=135208 RepID=A0A4Y9ZZ62_9AGAM|nr:hypothetical protein EWM64_g4668 [Hericium alpestre]
MPPASTPTSTTPVPAPTEVLTMSVTPTVSPLPMVIDTGDDDDDWGEWLVPAEQPHLGPVPPPRPAIYSQDPAQFEHWQRTIIGGCLLHVFNRTALDHQDESIRWIEAFLIHEGITKASIAPANPTSHCSSISRHERPPAVLIYGQDADKTKLLTDGKVFAHCNGTFIIHKQMHYTPSFLGYFQDFPGVSSKAELDNNANDLTTDLCTSLANSSLHNVLEHISAATPSLSHLLPGNRIAHILASLTIKPIKMSVDSDGRIWCWRLYMTSPAKMQWGWNDIKTWFHANPISTFLHGARQSMHTFSCASCHADDHPHGLCPFFSVPLWNGPPVQELPASREQDTPAVIPFQNQTPVHGGFCGRWTRD